MPAPIPFDAPVTTATFPFSFSFFIVRLSFFGPIPAGGSDAEERPFLCSVVCLANLRRLHFHAYFRGLMGRIAIGHRTDLFPLPQNERRLVLSKEVSQR